MNSTSNRYRLHRLEPVTKDCCTCITLCCDNTDPLLTERWARLLKVKTTTYEFWIVNEFHCTSHLNTCILSSCKKRHTVFHMVKHILKYSKKCNIPFTFPISLSMNFTKYFPQTDSYVIERIFCCVINQCF